MNTRALTSVPPLVAGSSLHARLRARSLNLATTHPKRNLMKKTTITLAALLIGPLVVLEGLPFFGCKPADLRTAIGFGPGANDFIVPLVGRYLLSRTSAHQVVISQDGGLGDDVLKIPKKVLECAVRKNLILAKRQGLSRRSPGNPNDLYEEPDPAVLDYWILDTAGDGKVFGPLTLEQFHSKQREFGIREPVALKDIYEFRK